MKNFGFYSFSVLIIILSALGAKLPDAGEEWSTMTLPFIVVALITVGALYCWRRGLKEELTGPSTLTQSQKEASGSLIELALTETKALPISSLSNEETCERIDQILHKFIYPFVEIKEREFNRIGFAKAAEIYIELAYSERMLNRIWTASSDGCKAEAEATHVEAIEGLERTVSKIKESVSV